jgi:hypothetical protein
LALSADPHCRRAAGLGATDEWRAPDRFDESLACQSRVFHPDRSLPRRRICLRAAVVAGLLFVNKVGAGAFAGLTITANILMSLAIDHFGWFNLPPHPMNIWRTLGAVLMVGGMALISRF